MPDATRKMKSLSVFFEYFRHFPSFEPPMKTIRLSFSIAGLRLTIPPPGVKIKKMTRKEEILDWQPRDLARWNWKITAPFWICSPFLRPILVYRRKYSGFFCHIDICL